MATAERGLTRSGSFLHPLQRIAFLKGIYTKGGVVRKANNKIGQIVINLYKSCCNLLAKAWPIVGNKVMKRNRKEAGICSAVSCHKCGQLPINEVCVNLFSKQQNRANCPHAPIAQLDRASPF